MLRLRDFLGLAGAVSAQFAGWTDEQVNTSICLWPQPRVALIRDTVYIDGGDLYWSRGLRDGQYGPLTDTGNIGGRILTYNLSKPFDLDDTNVTEILIEDSISKAIGGSGNAANSPNFIDGALLSNYHQFILYGGAAFTPTGDPPDGDETLVYMAYEYGPEKTWERGFNPIDIDNNVNRYVTYGAAVSAPSENKAWYFSGMTALAGGNIDANPQLDGSDEAHVMSRRMIEVNMEDQVQEEWTNRTLGEGIEGRAGAEAVWVPVGEQGVLVFLGGVTHPAWANSTTSRSDDEEASEEESPEFISTIDIYDIANNDWYRQETEDGPGQRARGCAVVAAAQDYSSFNIYYYGGHDGLNLRESWYDEVWVLSLPSFTWTELNSGNSGHARAGHRCVMPYPDQMMVIGGDVPRGGVGGNAIGCLHPGPIIMFNLSSGDWMNSYHPEEHADYAVPSAVLDKIGGDATGGATLTTPSPSGWDDDDLGDIFSSTYDTSKLSTFGPFEAAATNSERPDLPDDDDDNGGGGGGLPNWVGPVLGVILGLMVVTGAIVVFCLWRRRKSVFRNRSSDYGTEDPGNRIMSWIKGQSTETKTVTTSDDTPMSPEMADVKAVAAVPVSSPSSPPPMTVEAAGTPIAELDDTSPPAELSDTGLTPVEIIQKHSRLTSDKRSHSHQSYSSLSAGAVEYNSNISRSSLGGDSARPDSPSIPNSPEPGQSQGQMQSLTETLAEHDNQQGQWIGQQSVNWSGGQRPHADRRVSEHDTPVSPPTAGDAPGEDYISARAAMVSPLRRSIFRENEEDLGKK